MRQPFAEGSVESRLGTMERRITTLQRAHDTLQRKVYDLLEHFRAHQVGGELVLDEYDTDEIFTDDDELPTQLPEATQVPTDQRMYEEGSQLNYTQTPSIHQREATRMYDAAEADDELPTQLPEATPQVPPEPGQPTQTPLMSEATQTYDAEADDEPNHYTQSSLSFHQRMYDDDDEAMYEDTQLMDEAVTPSMNSSTGTPPKTGGRKLPLWMRNLSY